jgi:hypothetical protein
MSVGEERLTGGAPASSRDDMVNRSNHTPELHKDGNPPHKPTLRTQRFDSRPSRQLCDPTPGFRKRLVEFSQVEGR